MTKTPWKKIVSDPDYLGEADFNEGEEKIVTIDHVQSGVTTCICSKTSWYAKSAWIENIGGMLKILFKEEIKMAEIMVAVPVEEYKKLLKKEIALDGIKYLAEQNSAQEFNLLDLAEVKKLLAMLGVE